MKIEAVDFFYLSMPEIRCVGDGSQDALVVRVRAGDYEGWGECEASPLVSIAAWNCPPSHSACQPVSASVLGQRLDDPGDIGKIHRRVRENGLDLLQTDHTLSGIDIALWDLLGRKLETPVYRLLGYERAYPKLAYASVLFGDDVQATWRKARAARGGGFRAAKFGWGPYGRGDVAADAEQVQAAREGLGAEAELMVDAGTVWGSDVEAARARLPALRECGVRWLEEPFVSQALGAYESLSKESAGVALAAGEGCHQALQALSMMRYGGLGYIQIDTGRVGGISSAKLVAEAAEAGGEVTYVNHTFTTALALSASLQPYAGLERHRLCEVPVEASALARELTEEGFEVNPAGEVEVPEAPGLGVRPSEDALRRYLVEAEIRVGGRQLYVTPEL